ncbi:MAG: hypothetical protein BMS9Abin23_1117 [Thermodesulfobacteriota bacterium]|nr:MAG: hypothetical protein BMS9Abin23_1117 [Thermodesulfobacteriota bacterium]
MDEGEDHAKRGLVIVREPFIELKPYRAEEGLGVEDVYNLLYLMDPGFSSKTHHVTRNKPPAEGNEGADPNGYASVNLTGDGVTEGTVNGKVDGYFSVLVQLKTSFTRFSCLKTTGTAVRKSLVESRRPGGVPLSGKTYEEID